jgi:hypothetical protein
MSTELDKTLLAPIGNEGGNAGSTVSTGVDNKAIAVAGKYLNDPVLLMGLTDRVYQLLQEDLYLQRERVNNYSHCRWM